MPTLRRPLARHTVLLWGCVLGACGCIAPGTAWAQPSGVDEVAAPPGAVAAPGATPPAPVAAVPTPAPAPPTAALPPPAAPAAALDKVQGGISPLGPLPANAPPVQPATLATPAEPAAPADAGKISTATPGVPPPDLPAPVEAAPPAPVAAALPEPVSLDHPQVIDTARLAGGQKTVTLFGVLGLSGEAAKGLQGFVTAAGNRVTCQAQTSADFVCLLPDGTDVAEAALINGAARARDDAPAAYRDQEAAAQAARRGLWSNLPPPPVVLKHPIVQDTATLVAERQTYVLDGLQGLGAPYTGQLQGYIAANGDTLTCSPQPIAGTYICVLNDGTDIAKVALVNGAALVGQDAPDAYRVQQREALLAQRGYWQHPAPEMVVAATAIVEQPQECCLFVAGDDGVDGIAYVGGVPTAVIEGETAFLIFGGDDVGWGYYDHWHHWRGAPDRYRSHLDHFHEHGHGLRGYDHEGGRHGGEGMHPGGGGHQSAMAGGQGHPGGMGGPGGHPGGVAGGPGGHPGGGPGGHPGGMAGGGGPGGHPGGMAGGMGHPGGMTGGMGPGGHPGGMAGGMGPGGHPGGMAGGFGGGMGGHPGGMAGGFGGGTGGGFVHPGPSAGGFHPSGGGGGGFHPSGGGGGGGHGGGGGGKHK